MFLMGKHEYRTTYIPADHPLAVATGAKPIVRTTRHRVILWDKIGAGPHPCHWCGEPVDWKPWPAPDCLVVDHLDGDTKNNDDANLAPACDRCNKGRTPPSHTIDTDTELFVTLKNGTRLRADSHRCEWCGNDFLAEKRRRNPRFCSKQCLGKFRAKDRWG